MGVHLGVRNLLSSALDCQRGLTHLVNDEISFVESRVFTICIDQDLRLCTEDRLAWARTDGSRGRQS